MDSSKGRFLLMVALFGVIGAAIYAIYEEGGLSAIMGSANQTVLDLLFAAIKQAEGSPSSWNNPLDITDTGYPGDLGTANSAGVRRFDTLANGTAAGMAKLSNILNGASSVYSLNMTLAQFGATWSGGDPNWAINVASALGVDPSVTLNELNGGS